MCCSEKYQKCYGKIKLSEMQAFHSKGVSLCDTPFLQEGLVMIKRAELKKFAKENNIIAGITPARKFDELKDALSEPVPFVTYTAQQRTDPSATFGAAESIVCIGCPYPAEIAADRGISIAASGVDYHKTVLEMLEKLKISVGINGPAFSDTGPLVDRHVAYLCGLGYYGENGFIINENFGSMFFIGYIIADDGADGYDMPTVGSCGECRICLDACPSGALSGGKAEYKKCISYLTQLKGEIDPRTDEKHGRTGLRLRCMSAFMPQKQGQNKNSTKRKRL